MPDTCPWCGAAMLDDTLLETSPMARCESCDYWTIEHIMDEARSWVIGYNGWIVVSRTLVAKQPDGTIIAKRHAPNQPEWPDSCEADESPDPSEQRVNPYDLGDVARGMRRKR